MSELLHVTKDGSAPERKPGVYFCCHPEDFCSCFRAVAEDIFDKVDCTIYYHKDGQLLLEDENAESDIKRMQLFVMPVTDKLLHTPNQALDIEYRYAVEHGIPVLPLMQEKDLEGAFNAICGERQYLDKHGGDPTAIPYDKKLEMFLKDVLLDDDLTRKICSSFEGHIFLSYRKKDRKLAQDLMRKIHQSDAYRDVAIWYDEFLTPGESFHQEIRDAIDGSDLFVMTVTPNLLENDNYIITKEYPLAQKLNKPILPVQMKQTERDSLDQVFVNLPLCVDAQSDEALRFALQENFPVAQKEKDQNPLHSFYIGLAYLSGVQVEVDKDRAAELIRFAAEAELPEAMRKLASMYAKGEGVKCDRSIAAVWYEKHAKLAEARYRLSGAQEDAIACMDSLWEQASMLRVAERSEQAAAVYEHAVAFSESVQHRDTVEMLYCWWRSSFLYCRMLMDIHGDLSLKAVYYELGSSGTESKRQKNTSCMTRQEYLSMQAEMEACNRKIVELAQKTVQIAEQMAEAADAISVQDKLAHSYSLLGRVLYQRTNDTEAGERYYRKMLRIRERLARHDPAGYTHSLAHAYMTVGEVLGDFDMRWKGLDMLAQEKGDQISGVAPPARMKYRLIDGKFQLVEVEEP